MAFEAGRPDGWGRLFSFIWTVAVATVRCVCALSCLESAPITRNHFYCSDAGDIQLSHQLSTRHIRLAFLTAQLDYPLCRITKAMNESRARSPERMASGLVRLSSSGRQSGDRARPDMVVRWEAGSRRVRGVR